VSGTLLYLLAYSLTEAWSLSKWLSSSQSTDNQQVPNDVYGPHILLTASLTNGYGSCA